MAHNDSIDRFPRVLQPWHYTAMLLCVQGMAKREVARHLGKSYQTIKNVMASPLGKAALEQICNKTIDTMREVRTIAQLHAPEMIDLLLREARNGSESSARVRAQIRLLEIAGHGTTHTLVVDHSEVEEEFKDLGEDELRAKLLNKIKPVKDKGPDGSLLQ